MKTDDLFNQRCFSSEDMANVLYSKYQRELSDTTIRLCETDLTDVDYQNIWNDVKKKLINYSSAADLFAVVFDCNRKYLFSCIDSDRIKIHRNSNILSETDTSVPVQDTDSVNNILSLLSRKQFDYFMNRYFYMDDRTAVDPKYEKKIAQIMQLKGNMSILKVNGINKFPPVQEAYPYYLLKISDDMLMQIGGEGSIIPNKKISNLSFLLQRFSIMRASLIIGSAAALSALIIILLQIK